MPTQRKTAKGGSKNNFIRRLGLEKAVKLAFGINVKGRIQPSKALNMPRDKVRRLTERGLRRIDNMQNQLHKRLKRIEGRDKKTLKFNALVNTMCNWDRNQWARAGYPGLRQKDIKPVRKFAAMLRRAR